MGQTSTNQQAELTRKSLPQNLLNLLAFNDDPKMLEIPKWRLALPLALRRKDRLELLFERRGHGQAFDDHVVQGTPGDRI
jgi:hypothetical protein